jgi:hypothetical protein
MRPGPCKNRGGCSGQFPGERRYPGKSESGHAGDRGGHLEHAEEIAPAAKRMNNEIRQQ